MHVILKLGVILILLIFFLPEGVMGYFIQKFSPEPQGTVLLAEQNVKSALRLSDRGFIIDEGGIRYQGTIGEIRENEEVRKKYLLV